VLLRRRRRPGQPPPFRGRRRFAEVRGRAAGRSPSSREVGRTQRPDLRANQRGRGGGSQAARAPSIAITPYAPCQPGLADDGRRATRRPTDHTLPVGPPQGTSAETLSLRVSHLTRFPRTQPHLYRGVEQKWRSSVRARRPGRPGCDSFAGPRRFRGAGYPLRSSSSVGRRVKARWSSRTSRSRREPGHLSDP
jgi:hypothetical protein